MRDLERRALKDAHYISQHARWDQAGGKLSERQRAEVLADLELNVLWDEMSEHEQDQAVKHVEEDQAWPGLFDRLDAEAEQRRQKSEALERESAERRAAWSAARADEAKRQAELERERSKQRREQAEAAEQAEREDREAQRQQLAEQRDQLVEKRDQLLPAA